MKQAFTKKQNKYAVIIVCVYYAKICFIDHAFCSKHIAQLVINNNNNVKRISTVGTSSTS